MIPGSSVLEFPLPISQTPISHANVPPKNKHFLLPRYFFESIFGVGHGLLPWKACQFLYHVGHPQLLSSPINGWPSHRCWASHLAHLHCCQTSEMPRMPRSQLERHGKSKAVASAWEDIIGNFLLLHNVRICLRLATRCNSPIVAVLDRAWCHCNLSIYPLGMLALHQSPRSGASFARSNMIHSQIQNPSPTLPLWKQNSANSCLSTCAPRPSSAPENPFCHAWLQATTPQGQGVSSAFLVLGGQISVRSKEVKSKSSFRVWVGEAELVLWEDVHLMFRNQDYNTKADLSCQSMSLGTMG